MLSSKLLGIPDVFHAEDRVTDEAQAKADPELAVLSAMTRGRDADTGKAVRIAVAALAASLGLDEERSGMYGDLVRRTDSRLHRRAIVRRLNIVGECQ